MSPKRSVYPLFSSRDWTGQTYRLHYFLSKNGRIWTILDGFGAISAIVRTEISFEIHFDHIHWFIGIILWGFFTGLQHDLIIHHRKVSRLCRIVRRQCGVVLIQCRHCAWLWTDYPLASILFLYIAAMYYDFTAKSSNKTTKSLYIMAMYKDFVAMYAAVGSMYIYIRPMLFAIRPCFTGTFYPIGFALRYFSQAQAEAIISSIPSSAFQPNSWVDLVTSPHTLIISPSRRGPMM